MTRTRLAMVIGAAVLTAGGLGAGVSLAVIGSSAQGSSGAGATSPYQYYRSMMGGYGYRSMMGGYGYQWITGGTAAPGWMAGGTLPSAMMGTSTDPGKAMGALWANGPGPRVSRSEATALGDQVPGGATVDAADQSILFSTATVHLVALASPPGGPDETFRIAGLVNPKIEVPAGAQVSIQVINADTDTAHGLVVTPSGSARSWMPMMTAAPAFTGSAQWFLGDPTAAGLHVGTLSFTASTPGTYQYLCPVPGHAEKGMVGTFVVESAS